MRETLERVAAPVRSSREAARKAGKIMVGRAEQIREKFTSPEPTEEATTRFEPDLDTVYHLTEQGALMLVKSLVSSFREDTHLFAEHESVFLEGIDRRLGDLPGYDFGRFYHLEPHEAEILWPMLAGHVGKRLVREHRMAEAQGEIDLTSSSEDRLLRLKHYWSRVPVEQMTPQALGWTADDQAILTAMTGM